MRVEHTVAAPTADRARIESGRCRYLIRNPNSHEILRAQSLGLEVTRKMLSAELQRACRLHDEVERLASARGAAQVEAQERAPYRVRSYAVLRSPSVYAFTPVALFCCAVPCRLRYSFLFSSRSELRQPMCRAASPMSLGRERLHHAAPCGMRARIQHGVWRGQLNVVLCALHVVLMYAVCRMLYATRSSHAACRHTTGSMQHATDDRQHATDDVPVQSSALGARHATSC